MLKKISLILICSLISATGAIFLYDQIAPRQIIINEVNPASKVNVDEILFSGRHKNQFTSAAPTNFIDAADAGRPAVVGIRAMGETNLSSFRNSDFNSSSGSGVIISPDGYIATNNHVVENSKNIEITLNDNREFKAKLIGTDPASDLALLKIEEQNLPYLVFGNSDSLEIGEWVLAIGNPFRLQSTVTAGIVSAKARNINILENTGIESFIQTDAAVNPGNSGGALVNTNGELIGINTAIMTFSGRYEGFSFAIPSNLVQKIIYDIKEYGAVQRGWLGITIINVDSDRAKELDLNFVGGVYIDRVENKGAASEAGLKKGDVITSVNGVETMSTPAFMEQVAQFRPGDEIELNYFRNGRSVNANVVLRNQLNPTDFVAVRKDQILLDLGIELRDLDSDEKKRLNTDGVYVVSIYRGSKIEQTNMDPGYIITKINNQKIDSVDEVVSQLEKLRGRVYLDGFYENYPGEFPYTFYN